MKNRVFSILPTVLLFFAFYSCSSSSGESASIGEGNRYYDLTPVPDFILEKFGSFGPRERNYAIPDNAIFASPDGDANSDGRNLKKPTTINQAFILAGSCDTIVLRGGTYRTGNLFFNKQITIQPYLEEQPVLMGTKTAVNWERRGNYWVTQWDSMFYTEPPTWYKPGGRDGPPTNYNRDIVVVEGAMYRPAPDSTSLKEGYFYCDYVDSEIYLSIDPRGKSVEISWYENGIVRIHDANADKIGPTILGIDFLGYAASCINIEGNDPYKVIEYEEMPDAPLNTHIENCRLLFCGDDGLRLTSPDSYIGYNDISMIGNVAVVTRMSHNNLFEHNIVSNSNWFNLRIYPAGIKVFNQCHNYTIRNNYFADMPCEAIWYDVGHREGVVINNYFNNCGIGLKVEICHRTYIAGNVFNKANLWLCNSYGCLVYNNTMIDSRIDLWRNNRGAGNWNRNYSFNHAATGPGPYNYHGHHVANNVFAGDDPRGGFYALFEDNNKYDTNFLADVWGHNLLLKEADWLINAQFQPINPESILFASLEDFRGIYGNYEEGSEELDISSDELFRSVSAGDFRLNQLTGVPEGMPLPDRIATLLGWSADQPGLGAFAQVR